MAATDAPATLSELRTAFLDNLKEVTGNSAMNTIVDRFLNTGLQDMHAERWPWSERRSTIRTNPAYTTGTVTVAITSLTTRRTVTGASTLWTTTNSYGDQNAIGAGAKMTLGSNSVVHLVSTVDSATGITLDTATPFSGTAALAADSYAIYQDEYALATGFGLPEDIRHFDAERTIELIGPQEFYRWYPRNATRDRPRHATLIELGPSGSAALRGRVLFGPAPDLAYIIPYRFHTTLLAVSSTGTAAANLSAATDEPIVPLVFRMGIVWKALELWFSTRQKNAALAADFGGRYSTVMLRARQRSGPADPRPRFVPQVSSYWATARRPWRAGGRRRLDGDESFDQLLY